MASSFIPFQATEHCLENLERDFRERIIEWIGTIETTRKIRIVLFSFAFAYTTKRPFPFPICLLYWLASARDDCIGERHTRAREKAKRLRQPLEIEIAKAPEFILRG